MITDFRNIPFERLLSCEWVIITHLINGYLMSGDDMYRSDLKQLKQIKCGGSIGYKLNGRFRSMTWIKLNRKPVIKVMVKKYEIMPF
jgi:hypothetical protein